jgi:DNA-binding IclR family transcriptional regulator
MHQLSDDTQQSCHLAVPSDEFMVVIARIDPPADLGLVVRIGHRRPILEATSGLVLTAFQPPEAQRRWIEDFGGAMSPKLRALLKEKLEEIRRKGYAAIRSSAVVGIVDVSVPILRNDIAVAALAIPYLKRTGAPVAQRNATVMLQKVASAVASKLA